MANKKQVSYRLLSKDFKSFILKQEKILMEQYDFNIVQVKYLMKYKPTLLLFQEEYETKKTGIKAVYQVLVKEKGFEASTVKKLILNYPPIVSKSVHDLN